MKLKLPSLTISLLAFISIIILLSLIYSHNARPTPMTEVQAEECVDCVHYVNRVKGKITYMKTVDENKQFFKYALDKSCRGQMYLNGHCTKFRREFRKDVDRYMHDFENPYEACVGIKACK